MNSLQTYIGSAFSSYPVRWIETPESARSRSAADSIAEKKIADKKIEKVVDPDIGKPRSASGDVLDLSPEVQKTRESNWSDSRSKLENEDSNSEKTEKPASPSTEKLPSGMALAPEEQQEVAKLKALDQEVRIHEMAHVMAGGGFVTSGPSYTYKTGPDGKAYAVGGSVGIDTSPVAGDPAATIQKMQAIAAAALAPAQPSGQDQKVASAARQTEANARMELAQLNAEQMNAGQMQPEQSSKVGEAAQSESTDVSAFSIVRPADRMADFSPKSRTEDAVMPSLVAPSRAGSEFAPSAAYKAQSVMTLASSHFSAFA